MIIKISGYNSSIEVESISNYLTHSVDDLEFEITNLFKEINDREDRQNSK